MKCNVFIFHGVGGSPKENWFPWLKKELQYNRCNVIVPQFPTSGVDLPASDAFRCSDRNGPIGAGGRQDLANWLETFEKCKKREGVTDVDLENSIFIGHSLGGLFMLSLLEKYQIRMAVFVASFCKLPGNKFDEGMRTFVPEREDLPAGRQGFDWQKILENCRKSMVFHGDNDSYVGLGTAQQLARNLHAKLELVRGAGHFNGSTGFVKFPLLLEKLKKIL